MRLNPKATEKVIQHAKALITMLQHQSDSPLQDDSILGVYLLGSVIRGDFVPTVSDVDFAVVYDGDADDPVWESESFLQIVHFLENHHAGDQTRPFGARGVDVVTYSTGEINKAREDWKHFNFFGPRKFLGIYSFDLVENSMLLYGKVDVLSAVRVHSPEHFIESRIDAIAHNFNRASASTDWKKRLLMLSTTIGESARVACLAWGLRSLHKMDVYHYVWAKLPEFDQKQSFLEFYKTYIDGIPLHQVVRRYQPFESFCHEIYNEFRELVKSRPQ